MGFVSVGTWRISGVVAGFFHLFIFKYFRINFKFHIYQFFILPFFCHAIIKPNQNRLSSFWQHKPVYFESLVPTEEMFVHFAGCKSTHAMKSELRQIAFQPQFSHDAIHHDSHHVLIAKKTHTAYCLPVLYMWHTFICCSNVTCFNLKNSHVFPLHIIDIEWNYIELCS